VRWGAIPGCQKGFFPRQDELDRTSGLFGQQSGNHGVFAGLEFAAETASHVMPDHADLGQREAENPRDLFLHCVYALGRFPDGEPVAVPVGHTTVQFHGGVDLARGTVGFFQNHVGFLEAPIGVSSLVCLGLNAIFPVVNRRSAGLQGLCFVDYEGSFCQFNLDGAKRVLSLIRSIGRHGGNHLSLKPTLGIKQSGLHFLGR
jgi:hypothetical protein